MKRVYFVKNTATGLIKMGRSVRVAARLQQLEFQYGKTLELLVEMPENSFYSERLLHRRFAGVRADREWFLPDADLLLLIEQLKISPIYNPTCSV